jgi:hypothetical protein
LARPENANSKTDIPTRKIWSDGQDIPASKGIYGSHTQTSPIIAKNLYRHINEE